MNPYDQRIEWNISLPKTGVSVIHCTLCFLTRLNNLANVSAAIPILNVVVGIAGTVGTS